MAVYLLRVAEPNTEIEQRIQVAYPNDNYEISKTEWLISSQKIAKDIGDELSMSDGKSGQYVIFWISGYHGWWSKSIWDWLKLKGV